MTDLIKLKAANTARWAKAKLTRGSEFLPVANSLVKSRDRFLAMSGKTEVPWAVIAVIKQRESGNDPKFLGNIANGQPWTQRTTIVPKGRGPFSSWEEAALDALINCAPQAAKWKDWSPGGALTLLELYNGTGYANGPKDAETGIVYPPQPSPYVWSGTDQYKSGKYVRDHVYKPDVVDAQLGCAGLILAMMEIDPSITFLGAAQVADLPELTIDEQHDDFQRPFLMEKK